MHKAGWDDQVSVPACNARADATQDMLCTPCCSGALLSPVQPDVHSDPQALSLPHRSEPALGSVGMSPQVQHLARVLMMNFALFICFTYITSFFVVFQ